MRTALVSRVQKAALDNRSNSMKVDIKMLVVYLVFLLPAVCATNDQASEGFANATNTREDLVANGTRTAKVLSAKAVAPIITSASKISSAVAALPPLFAERGAALGSMIATPVESGAVAASGLLSAISAFVVSVPVAVDSGIKTLGRREAEGNIRTETLSRSRRHLPVNITQTFDGMWQKISSPLKNLTTLGVQKLKSNNFTRYVIEKYMPSYFGQNTSSSDSVTDYSTTVASTKDLYITTTVTTTTTPVTTTVDQEDQDIEHRYIIKPLIRVLRTVTERMHLSEAVPLAESLGFKDCIRRLICEVGCDQKVDTTPKRKVYNTVKSAEESGQLSRLPQLADYKAAWERGKKAKKCNVCRTSYTCRNTNKEMLDYATRLDLEL